MSCDTECRCNDTRYDPVSYGCSRIRDHKPEIHWMEQLRRDIEFKEILRRNNRPSARLKRWARGMYYKLFPSMSPLNWIKVIPMKPPSGVDTYHLTYEYKYGSKH